MCMEKDISFWLAKIDLISVYSVKEAYEIPIFSGSCPVI